MKNTRNRIPKKERKKADVRVLGQILAAQNIDFVLPDTTHIAEFFAETLIGIPGIQSCRVCLEDITIRRGGRRIGVCEECLGISNEICRIKRDSLAQFGFQMHSDRQAGHPIERSSFSLPSLRLFCLSNQ